MTAQVIRLLATSRTPRYRPLPTEPATVIILPVIRAERPPAEPPIMSRKTASRVMIELEKLRRAMDRETQLPCDVEG